MCILIRIHREAVVVPGRCNALEVLRRCGTQRNVNRDGTMPANYSTSHNSCGGACVGMIVRGCYLESPVNICIYVYVFFLLCSAFYGKKKETMPMYHSIYALRIC